MLRAREAPSVPFSRDLLVVPCVEGSRGGVGEGPGEGPTSPWGGVVGRKSQCSAFFATLGRLLLFVAHDVMHLVVLLAFNIQKVNFVGVREHFCIFQQSRVHTDSLFAETPDI